MKHRPALLGTLILALVMAGPAAAQEMDPMAGLIEEWETHFNAGHFDVVAALYTEDAVRHPPGQPAHSGREAIAADMANYAHLTIDLELGGSEMSGDMISSWGMYSLYARDGEGDEPVQSGPWMNIARKGEDGTWKIARDIWNLRQQP